MSVAILGELSATPLDRPFGLADDDIRTAEHALLAVGHLVEFATVDYGLAGVGVVDSLLDPSGRVAQRRHYIKGCEPGMVDGPRGSDEFFGPCDGFVIFALNAEHRRVGRDGGGDVEITLVGGPPERGAQVGHLDAEPRVGLALAGAVPQGHDVGFASGEVPRVRGPNLGCFTAGDELFLGELADRLQHRIAGPPRGPISNEQRLAHQGIEAIQDHVVVGVIETGDSARTVEVEPAREHRTPIQQRLLRLA